MAYDDKSIKILEGLEAVRKRPGMYIGSTDKRGLHHLVWEIVDNAVDEAINGYGSKISVTITKSGSIRVSDEGRGVPCGMHESGVSTPEVIYTVLHAGGKFESGGYKVSGGLHGVGASVVNALSKKMVVRISRDGHIHEITFKDGGNVDTPLQVIGNTRSTGTTVEFWPDETIFDTTKFSFSTIQERMQESAFLIKDLTIEIKDEIGERENTFHYENGIVSFVEYINENKTTLHKTIDMTGEKNGIEVNVAMCYTDSYNENIISFVNNVKTIDGGTHEAGFKSAITKVFNEYVKDNNLLKGKNTLLEGSDTREGLTAVISVNIPENLLQFEGQTKGKLGTPQARSVVESIVSEKLSYFLEENKTVAGLILDKALKSKVAREAARKAREEARNGKSKSDKNKILNGKLTKAAGKNPMKNELFLVEGDSAGGSAKTGRDRNIQAILPLRGKVLNCEKASTNDINGNEELNLIIQTIGAGVGSSCNPSESNYGKVIIMTDADDDGAHIQILLLTFFYRFMKPLIEAGMIFVANPPLYSIEYAKVKEYIQTDEDLAEKKKTIKGSYKVNRFKGLGEMDAEELFETTMDPEKRSLIKVTIEDAMLAEKRVSVLMGDKVDPRKEWIEENVDFTLEDNFRR